MASVRWQFESGELALKDRVEITVDKHIAEVMLNRPDKFNALDVDMFHALDQAARTLAADTSIRAVVLHGSGENFCAGIDVGVLQGGGEEVAKALLASVDGSPANLAQRAAYAWRELPVPVICALQGVTYGGGLQIAMGADLRYAAANTRLSVMESKWGIIPDMAISTTLRNIVPPDRVKELAWTARIFDAEEALRLGVITAIEDDPLGAARQMAGIIGDRSPDAIQGIKRLVNEAWSLTEDDSLALEATLQRRLLGSRNQAEAVRANLEKRSPNFHD
jgi:enoyl-CoA hydratase/carnithine racemase